MKSELAALKEAIPRLGGQHGIAEEDGPVQPRWSRAAAD